VGPPKDVKTNPNYGRAGGGSKAVCFILDVSGSMRGSRLRVSKENMIMVFNTYVFEGDLVSYIEFDHTVNVKFELAPKDPWMTPIFDAAAVHGATNFYDAMIEGIDQLSQAPGGMPKYIIALTDGDSGQYRYSVNDVTRELRNNTDITPMVIGAGSGISHGAQGIIRRIVGEQPADPSIAGMYIQADNLDDLSAAFAAVAEKMVGGGDALDEDI